MDTCILVVSGSGAPGPIGMNKYIAYMDIDIEDGRYGLVSEELVLHA
jgi:hypothetical protein